jgi:hypothetical protein
MATSATIFPTSPTVGQTFTSTGIKWKWDGYKWALFTDPAVVFEHLHSYDGAVVSTGAASGVNYDGGGANPV